MEFTLGEETEKSSKKELSSNELSKQLERLIQDQADNQRVFDWVEVCSDEGGWRLWADVDASPGISCSPVAGEPGRAADVLQPVCQSSDDEYLPVGHRL